MGLYTGAGVKVVPPQERPDINSTGRDFMVTTVEQAIKALRRLAAPGAPRWAVSGWATALHSPWADGPRIGAINASEPDCALLVQELAPAPASLRWKHIDIPDWVEIEDRARYLEIKKAAENQQPTKTFYIPNRLLDRVIRIPGTDWARFLTPEWIQNDVLGSDARLLAIQELWKFNSDAYIEDVRTLVCWSCGLGRADTGNYSRTHPSKRERSEGITAASHLAFQLLSRVDPDRIVEQIVSGR